MSTYDDIDHEIARMLPEVLATEKAVEAVRNGEVGATNTELLSGFPFREDSVPTDCAMWSFRQLEDARRHHGRGPLPPAVKRGLVKLTSNVSLSTLLETHRAAGRHRDEWSGPYIARLVDIQTRLDIYLWQMGDEAAATRCALAALDRLRRTVGEDMRVGLLATALTITTGMNPRGIVSLAEAATRMNELRTRTARRGGMQRWLDQYYADQAAADELPEPVVEDEIDLMTAVAEDRDRGAWAYAQPGPQSRVVFGHMDHLPKVSQMARERGDTPRAVVANLEGVPLPLRRLEADILQVAFDLHSRFPWLSDIIDDLVMDLAMTPAWLALPRIIFAGAPGCGKTSLAIAICNAIGIPATVYSAAGVADGSFGGTSRQWSTGRICVPGQAVIQAKIANPAIIIDEVEKAGTSRSNGNFTDTVLALTEPTSSRVYHDPYLEAPIDLSAVSYLGTVNNPDLLPSPLRDRFRIVNVPAPGVEHLPAIVRGMVADIRAERGCRLELLPDLAPDEIEILADGWNANSMRSLRRSVVAMLKSRERLATRN